MTLHKPVYTFARQLYLLVLCADRAGQCGDDGESWAQGRTDNKNDWCQFEPNTAGALVEKIVDAGSVCNVESDLYHSRTDVIKRGCFPVSKAGQSLDPGSIQPAAVAFTLNPSPNTLSQSLRRSLPSLPLLHPLNPFPSTTSTTSAPSPETPPPSQPLLSLPTCPPRLPQRHPFRAGRSQGRAPCPSRPRPTPHPTPARLQNAHAIMLNNPLPRHRGIPNAVSRLPGSAPTIVFSGNTPSPKLSVRVVWERLS